MTAGRAPRVERYKNLGETGKTHGFRDLLRWMQNRERGPWSFYRNEPHGETPPDRVGAGGLRVTYINHATWLIQLDGLNILTDPIFTWRAGPTGRLGPKRVRPAGLALEQLPPLDAVLVSHNHYDHLSLPSLQALAERSAFRLVLPEGNRCLLPVGLQHLAHELRWWQGLRLAHRSDVFLVPARHFSQRTAFDRNRALWGGFVLRSAHGNVYFAGDTGYGPHFAMIGERFGPFRTALLPIGAYRPRWFMAPMHIDPTEALQAHRDLRSSLSLAMHWGTFPLADDGETEPLRDLQEALRADDLSPGSFRVLDFGEGLDVPPLG